MVQFSRALRRWSLFRVGGATIAVAWLVVLAAFAYGATSTTPDLKTAGAAVFALGIAAACILYAWREPGP
jgi:hypothetical protein